MMPRCFLANVFTLAEISIASRNSTSAVSEGRTEPVWADPVTPAEGKKKAAVSPEDPCETRTGPFGAVKQRQDQTSRSSAPLFITEMMFSVVLVGLEPSQRKNLQVESKEKERRKERRKEERRFGGSSLLRLRLSVRPSEYC